MTQPDRRIDRFWDRLQISVPAATGAIMIGVCATAHSVWPAFAWVLGIVGGMWFGIAEMRRQQLADPTSREQAPAAIPVDVETVRGKDDNPDGMICT